MFEELEEFIVYWAVAVIIWRIVTATIAMKIAENNGRQSGLFIVLGFWTGLIGVLVALIAGKSRERRIEDKAREQVEVNRLAKEMEKMGEAIQK